MTLILTIIAFTLLICYYACTKLADYIETRKADKIRSHAELLDIILAVDDIHSL